MSEAPPKMKRLLYIVILSCASSFCLAQLNTERIIAIGRNALYFDDYVLGIQYFNQVIKIKPYLYEPYLLRAIAKIELGDYTGAEQDCNAAIERNPFHPGAYYTRAYVYRLTGQTHKAEQDICEALIFAPENRTYIAMRADLRAELKQLELALQDINHLLYRDPHSAPLLFEKGTICLRNNDTICALNAFQESVQYDSQNSSNWSALGVVQLMLNQHDDALQSLSNAIEQDSKWAGDYMNRGMIYYQRHNYRGAISDFDKAVALAPNDPQCYYNRGLLRMEIGDYNRAIDDFTEALVLDPDCLETYYNRGMVQLQLHQWELAIQDFDTIIQRTPFFLPAYYLAAQAHTSLGHTKVAQDLRQQAQFLEQNKDSVQALQTNMQVAQAQPQQRNRAKEFSARAAQNQEANEQETQYSNQARGTVQNQHTDIISEPNIVLSYYAVKNNVTSLRRTNYSHASVDAFNQRQLLPSTLRFTTQELTLTAEMVDMHFNNISHLSQQIDLLHQISSPSSPQLHQLSAAYFARAMEFALVQDYSSAIDDLTQATRIEPTMYFAYFCRANWRYKLLEYRRAMGEKIEGADFELMLRDYDYVITQQPDFAFAYYNKANMVCFQKDFRAAISYYTQAIEIDADFAEAYFNRGLTYIYLNDIDKGLADLSKAGELGIYQAYNLISQFQ